LELAYLPNGKIETGLSEDIPLWVETIEEEPVVKNGSDMFPSLGHVVDIESAGPDLVVSASPTLSLVIILVLVCFLWRALVLADTYKLEDALEKSDSPLEQSPKVAYLVADCGPSVYDEAAALVEESRCPDYFDYLPGNSEGDSDLPLEEEVGVVYIHCEVEMDRTRFERQWATGVAPEPEPCIMKGGLSQGGLLCPVASSSRPRHLSRPDPMRRARLIPAQRIRPNRPGHKELTPQPTIPDADDYDIDEAISRLLCEIRREKRANQQLLSSQPPSERTAGPLMAGRVG
jgi:hypothetical protein